MFARPRRALGSPSVPVTIVLLVFAAVTPLSAARTPIPVSPGGEQAGVSTEARCPTFSWAGVPNAAGYELAIFRVSAASVDEAIEGFEISGTMKMAEPKLVTRLSLPADSRSWTPPVGQCLERGERYAWSVAASAGSAEIEWAEPFLFEVVAAPSAADVEQALATLQRYLAAPKEARDGAAEPERQSEIGDDRGAALVQVRGEREQSRQSRVSGDRSPRQALDAAVTSPTVGIRAESAATSPVAGAASLTLSNQLHLAEASAVFRNGELLLWDDATSNTAFGRSALSAVSGDATNNTAVGRNALKNTTGGANSDRGSKNTAVGDSALEVNTTGYWNTAVGHWALRNSTGARNTATGYVALRANTTGENNTAFGGVALRYNVDGDANTASGALALRNNTTGSGNTAGGFVALRQNTTGSHNSAIGMNALRNNISGDRNVAVGYRAGFNLTSGSDNIDIGHEGVAGEAETIRLGSAQTRTFVAGVRGVTTGSPSGIAVLIDSKGQLGTVSSSRRLKQDIQDAGVFAERVMELHPVAFRFRQHVAEDPEAPLEFGLIAEEVAEVLPELVVYDQEGRPETVKYRLLSSLLLGELQQQRAALEEQHEEIVRLRSRLGAVERADRAAKANKRSRHSRRRGAGRSSP